MTTEDAKKIGRDLTNEEIANLVLTPQERIECELVTIAMSAEMIQDVEADMREKLVGDILGSVEWIKKALTELAGKDQRTANA